MNNTRVKKRVFFCYNQIALSVAVSSSKTLDNSIEYIIFYSSDRCHVEPFINENCKLISYKAISLFKFIFFNINISQHEVCLPHFKGSFLIKIYAQLAGKNSLVDDGLDTLRLIPNNIDTSSIKNRTLFYTFNYNFKLSPWLNKCEVIPTCNISEFAKSSKPKLDLTGVELVIVESTGLTDKALFPIIKDLQKTLLIRHSNLQKNNLIFSKIRCVKGSDYALEKSLENYDGRIAIGTSMLTVFLLLVSNPLYQIIFYASNKTLNNIPSFKDLINITKAKVEIHEYAE